MAGKERTVLIVIDACYSNHTFNWYLRNMRQECDTVVLVRSVNYSAGVEHVFCNFDPQVFDKDMLATISLENTQKVQQELQHFAQLMRQEKLQGSVKSVNSSDPGRAIAHTAKAVGSDVIIAGFERRAACTKINKSMDRFIADILRHSVIPVIVCEDSYQLHDPEPSFILNPKYRVKGVRRFTGNNKSDKIGFLQKIVQRIKMSIKRNKGDGT